MAAVDPWDLVARGDFEAALRSYDSVLAEHPAPQAFYNRGMVHLNLGRYADARADFETAEDRSDARGDGYRQSIGVTHWLEGDRRSAVDVWTALLSDHESGAIAYSDAVGGVEAAALVLFGAVWTADTALAVRAHRHLRRRAKLKRASNWPGPVARYLVDQISAADLLAAVGSTPGIRERRLCQAAFYIAVRSREHGEVEECRTSLHLAAAQERALLESELYLAKFELEQASS